MSTWRCRFWSCSEFSQDEESWCREHLVAFRRGLLDNCPECGWGKETRFPTCAGCRRVSRALHAALHGENEFPVAPAPRGFHVYVLQLDGGDFLAGYSRDLRVRLMEHQDGVIPPTADRSPELVWFTWVESRMAAKTLKVRLKRLCDDDPREMRRWIIRFQDLVRELRLP